ncbi:Hypothetical predicted protein, partial [Paramuricea clavata]
RFKLDTKVLMIKVVSDKLACKRNNSKEQMCAHEYNASCFANDSEDNGNVFFSWYKDINDCSKTGLLFKGGMLAMAIPMLKSPSLLMLRQ